MSDTQHSIPPIHCCAPRRVAVTGWDRRIFMFKDMPEDDLHMAPVRPLPSRSKVGGGEADGELGERETERQRQRQRETEREIVCVCVCACVCLCQQTTKHCRGHSQQSTRV